MPGVHSRRSSGSAGPSKAALVDTESKVGSERQDPATETGVCNLSSPKNTAVEIPPLSGQCETNKSPAAVSMLKVDAQNSPIRFDSPVTETGVCTMSSFQNTAVETSPVNVQHSNTDEYPIEVSEATVSDHILHNVQNSPVYSEATTIWLESATETGGCTTTKSSPRHTTDELSPGKAQHSESNECPVHVSEPVMNAENLHVHSDTWTSRLEIVTETGGCITSSARNTTDEISRDKAHCSKITEHSIAVSELMVNTENSPVHSESQASRPRLLGETAGCMVSNAQNTADEISCCKAQCSGTDESPVKVSVLVVDAQNSPVHSETSPSRLESVTETDGCMVLNPENTTVEISPGKAHCFKTGELSTEVPDAQDLPIYSETSPSRLESVTKTDGCMVSNPENTTVEISPAKAHCFKTGEPSTEVPDAQNFPVYSETSLSRLESVTEADGCTKSDPENTTDEIPPDRSETDEPPVLVVDAQNAPIHYFASVDVGSSTVRQPASHAVASHSDTQLMDTAHCSVQTSAHMVDHSCSPLPCTATCSVGCSPLVAKTETATSPIRFFPGIECSMQTEQWMINVECSPMMPSQCAGYHAASAQTSAQHCSGKYSTASFSEDRPQSPRTADSTSPILPHDSLPPACGEENCRKVSTESSYATPSGMACNRIEDPSQLVAAADCPESFEVSPQPHSCEELFGDTSQLSPSSAAHRHIYPSQLALPLESSHSSQNCNSNTQPVELEDPTTAVQKSLSLDDSCSLESSQVFPKCRDEEEGEEVVSNHSDDETYPVAV